jgi:radical SAM protein with 4Fe4S-binding SPASM domain
MISKELIYRIYGNTLAIIMHVPQKRVILLQGELLFFWLNLLRSNSIANEDRANPLFAQLLNLGVTEDRSRKTNTTARNTSAPDNIDIGMINLWAFKNRIPLSGHFELTGQCNLRCRHCYCTFHTKQDTLNSGQIFKIIDDLKECGTFGLVLTGGELFFRKDIMDILDYLHEKQFVLRINTNGTLINEATAERLSKYTNIYRMHVSLYSSVAEVHDRITSAPGSFEKTLRALTMLKEAQVDLRINCSVMKTNFETYQTIETKIGNPLGIPVHYDSEIFPKDDGGTENLSERLDPDQVREYLRFRTGRIKNPAEPKKQKLCKAGFSFFSICEDGSLYPCLKMKRYYRNPIGNLASESFINIWQSAPSILNIRETLDKKLRECDICDVVI